MIEEFYAQNMILRRIKINVKKIARRGAQLIEQFKGLMKFANHFFKNNFRTSDTEDATFMERTNEWGLIFPRLDNNLKSKADVRVTIL